MYTYLKTKIVVKMYLEYNKVNDSNKISRNNLSHYNSKEILAYQ